MLPGSASNFVKVQSDTNDELIFELKSFEIFPEPGTADGSEFAEYQEFPVFFKILDALFAGGLLRRPTYHGGP